MANVIDVLGSLDGVANTPNFRTTLAVKAGAISTIKRGYLVIKDGGNAGYAKAAADACDTDQIILGVALSDSTDTVAADGTVEIIAAPVMYVKLKATIPANLVATMKYSVFILDVTAGSYTLDQATSTKGLFRLISFDNVTDGNCIATLKTNW